MREIIFKGQRVDNGEWIEGALFEGEKFCIIGQEIKFSPYVKNECKIVGFEVIPETVGQYTGLKDKNGKKIFEGDVCRTKNHILIDETPFVVEWDDFVYMGWTWRDLDDDGSVDSFTNGVAKNCEVIGNIHDNPELLEGGAE